MVARNRHSSTTRRQVREKGEGGVASGKSAFRIAKIEKYFVEVKMREEVREENNTSFKKQKKKKRRSIGKECILFTF